MKNGIEKLTRANMKVVKMIKCETCNKIVEKCDMCGSTFDEFTGLYHSDCGFHYCGNCAKKMEGKV